MTGANAEPVAYPAAWAAFPENPVVLSGRPFAAAAGRCLEAFGALVRRVDPLESEQRTIGNLPVLGADCTGLVFLLTRCRA